MGTELLGLTKKLGRNAGLEYLRVTIDPENAASRHVVEKRGGSLERYALTRSGEVTTLYKLPV